MFGTYIGNGKMLVKLAYNGMLAISSKDLSLMPSLVTMGAIEVPLTKFFINQIKPGDTVVDVGANVGYFTVLAAMLVGTRGNVIGFEANPDTYAMLKDNIAMNWLTEQTRLMNKAVYSTNTTLQFYAAEKFQGDSSIQIRPERENILDRYTIIDVEAVKLDDELKQFGRIDILKIDIEGGEYHAFSGMMELIEQKRIKRIAFEWNKAMLGADAKLFVSLLQDIENRYGGKLYALDQEGNVLSAEIEDIAATDFYPFAIIQFM